MTFKRHSVTISDRPDAEIAIAGAGIAGLTAALALARRGRQILLFDRRAELDEAGAGIQLSPNASGVLIGLGLAKALAQVAVAPGRLLVRRVQQPRSFASMAMNDGGPRYDAPFWVVSRQDLHAALLAAVEAEPGVTLLRGQNLVDARAHATGTELILRDASGADTRLAATILLAADGVHSAGRALLGDPTPPRFAGFEAWRALVAADDVQPFARSPFVNLWMGAGWHLVHYPVSAGKRVNMVLVREAAQPRDGWSRPGDPADLEQLLVPASRTLRDLLLSAPEWRVWSLHHRHAPGRMARGCAALLGDAAHPMLPFLAQGGAMAIEDAAVLVAVLPEGPLTPAIVEAALARYARLRQPRVERVQAKARQNALIYHAGPILAFARDAALSRLNPETFLKRYDWLYGWKPPH